MSRHTTYFSTAPAAFEPASFLRTTGASGLHVPAIAGAVAVAFWLRATDNGQYGSFLVDFRENGTGWWWNRDGPADLSRAAVDGVSTRNYSAVFTPGWHKVYLEFATLDQAFYLLCRYSNNEFFFPSDVADITFYGRPFTAVELADATGPLPASGVLARYRHLTPSRAGVADSTGRCPDLAIIGAPVADSLPLLWVRADSLAPGPLAQWPNLGYAGPAQRLAADAATLPVAHYDAQNGCHFVRFVGQDWLTTAGAVGPGGTQPFSVLLVLRTHRPQASQNVLGWGALAQGQLFDLFQNGEQLAVHYYGTSGAVSEAHTVRPGHWQVLLLTNEQLQLAYLDGQRKNDAVAGAQPQAGPLRLGAGQWPNLNGSETIDVAECRLYDNVALLDTQRPALLAALARTYAGGVAQRDEPVASAAWQFASTWTPLVATNRPDIHMPFAGAMQEYSPGAPTATAQLTFQVTGLATEGVRIYGMVEGNTWLDVALNGTAYQTLSGRGGYTDITNPLFEVFGLPPGTHTVQLTKPGVTSTGGNSGTIIGGATVFYRPIEVL
jgi:hypothetical protein